ncbi:hypothetical protein HCN44_003025 [Aphidius gifuensis]|uniref:Peptidase M14 domain-containing protein n=1 Tax=Aphidius gifuensis TaxID=684658 RepID=A0A834XJJ2_APHGI|nr:hypothetical protein HCN44_003025 [Aphidius gifuensis]
MPECNEPVTENTENIGNFLTRQNLQDRFGYSRKDVDSVLPITSSILKYREADVQTIDVTNQDPRWPTECKVIQEKIRHIDFTPPTPEPYYVPTGKEPKPKPITEDMGTVVYNYCPTSATNYFSRSCPGGTVILTSSSSSSSLINIDSQNIDFTKSSHNNNTKNDLKFESRFESGNLGKVIKITDTYYQLHLRKDLYTQKHMQWFYFRISNTKYDSLYNDGLKPLLYSTKDANMHAVGWRRCGDNITYYKNDSSDEEKEKHTLTFNITFPHDQDIVYLAHCYPYTYSDLQEYLTRLSSDPLKSKFTKLRLLCRTLAGNNVHYLTITAPNYNDDCKKKKGIVITARVHPGETPSSWMMKGIIDFLTGESNQAKELREKFIFKLVPMLNPDGVIVGNNRCSLSGKDLNRQYRTVMRESYPSVWHTKLMIRRLMEECGIVIYCDLHAHSRKHNIFIYGCESKRAGCYGKLTEQIFPLMLHKNSADKFSFENCKFHIEKGKEGTSRVVVWLMGIQNSYTMEASMGGSKLGSRNGTHFSTQDYEQIEKLRNKILVRLGKEGSSADEPTNINLTDYSSDEGDTSDSSTEQIKIIKQTKILVDQEITIDSQQYLLVPPPSPQLLQLNNHNKFKKLRKKNKMEKNHYMRRKLLNRRSVMDLPATDPGSGCDLTDSADEYYLNTSENFSKEERSISPVDNKKYNYEKKDYLDVETLPILRPHTLSFVDESFDDKIHHKMQRKTRGTQPVRFMRNLSPILPRSQDVQIKLTSLRQQIWTGVSDNDEDDSFGKTPLSWGVSHLAMMYKKNGEALLKSCSKKLESLNSLGNHEQKKSKKNSKSSSRLNKNQTNDDNIYDDIQKLSKKKRIRSKNHKINNTTPEELTNTTTKINDQIDSLKLFGIAKLPNKQNGKLKNDSTSKKKFKRSGIVATTGIHVSKLKNNKIIIDTSSSDDLPTIINNNNNNNRPRINKKKKKSTLTKNRALSANFLLNDKS